MNDMSAFLYSAPLASEPAGATPQPPARPAVAPAPMPPMQQAAPAPQPPVLPPVVPQPPKRPEPSLQSMPAPVHVEPARPEPVFQSAPVLAPAPAPEPIAPVLPPVPPRPRPDAMLSNQRPTNNGSKRHASANTKMPSFGILDPLLADQRVHDILINGMQNIYVDIDGQLQDSGLRFGSEEEIWQLAEKIMQTIGHKWSPERPMIDTRLPDGSRVNIVAPPMAVDGVSISIRKFPAMQITLDSMAENGQLMPELAHFLKLCAARRLNMIVSGGTSSGKTTLLNALSAAISPRERIVTIEDTAELRLQQPHVVRLEAKPPISPDAPHTAVTIRDLVKNALRMRPDRVIVGESRGAEVFDVLQAMNTGHDGSMTSLHANSPREALSRLETMVSLAMPQMATRIVRSQIASTVNLIIQMSRGKDGSRRITHVSEISGMEGEMIVMQDLMTYQEAANGRPGEYRWVTSSPRNMHVTEAAREAGIIRPMR